VYYIYGQMLFTKWWSFGSVFRWDQRLRPNGSTLVSVPSSDQPITAAHSTAHSIMSSLTSSLISPYFFVYLRISEKVKWFSFHQNLISNRLTYLVHAKSIGELIRFGFSDRSVRSLVSVKRSANHWVQTEKNDFSFWLIFGLFLNLGLSERLIQKVKWPIWSY